MFKVFISVHSFHLLKRKNSAVQIDGLNGIAQRPNTQVLKLESGLHCKHFSAAEHKTMMSEALSKNCEQ